jgi:hypothetical protein
VRRVIVRHDEEDIRTFRGHGGSSGEDERNGEQAKHGARQNEAANKGKPLEGVARREAV